MTREFVGKSRASAKMFPKASAKLLVIAVNFSVRTRSPEEGYEYVKVEAPLTNKDRG